MTTRRLALAGVLLAELACSAPATPPMPQRDAAAGTSPSVCLREGELLVGEPPVEARQPVNASGYGNEFPRLPPGVMLTSGWKGELLIDKTGRVVRVWTTGRSTTLPAGVPIDDLMAEAMLAWRYEPVLALGQAVPACLGLVIFIN